MNLLLDSHVVIWAVDAPSKIGAQANLALRDPSNGLVFSAASIWEIGIKVGLGKLSLSLPFLQWFTKAKAELGLSILPITIEHADEQSRLPFHHQDPFDRLLISQARVENLTLISGDTQLDLYGISRV